MGVAPKHPTFAVRPRRRSSGAHSNTHPAVAELKGRRAPRRLNTAPKPLGWLDELLERPQMLVGTVCVAVFLLGTAISVYAESSISTSHLHHVHNTAPLRAAYFAQKHNHFNKWFVKRCWGWTAAIYLLHLFTSPGTPPIPSSACSQGRVNPALHAQAVPGRRSRAQRLAALVLASLAWILFTAWCFGAGLGDRIIQMSGGTCTVSLPPGIMDIGALEPLLPPGHTTPILHSSVPDPHRVGGRAERERIYLPLPETFCAHRTPLNANTHPRLFAVLAAAHEAHEKIHAALHLPPPRWHGGFDISGHAFLLTLAAIILAAELAPSWRRGLARSRGYERSGRRGLVYNLHVASTALGTLLIGLWILMLFVTAVYFHDVDEKLAGLGLGILAATVVHFAIPASATPVIEYKIRGPQRRPTRESSPPLITVEDDEERERVENAVDSSPEAHTSALPTTDSPLRLRPVQVPVLGAVGRDGLAVHHDHHD